MHDGIVEPIGTPLELFVRPGNLFVAPFTGLPAMNAWRSSLNAGAVPALGARWPGDGVHLAVDAAKAQVFDGVFGQRLS